MGDISFLGALMSFPKEQITDETCELLEPYMRAPDYNFESAKKASGNVAGLCNWCRAMYTYHHIAKDVEPKIAMLREAEAELRAAVKEKDQAESKMADVQASLDKMQAEFDEAMAEKKRLEDDATATQRRMDSANALITALSGEEIRWTAQSKEFDATIQRLTGDCALASSFVSYLGPFNKEFRELLLTRDFYGDCIKKTIPVTQNMQVSKFLVDDAEVGEWNLQGLPTDELSIQNGIMVTRATRCAPRCATPSPRQAPARSGSHRLHFCHSPAPARVSPLTVVLLHPGTRCWSTRRGRVLRGSRPARRRTSSR